MQQDRANDLYLSLLCLCSSCVYLRSQLFYSRDKIDAWKIGANAGKIRRWRERVPVGLSGALCAFATRLLLPPSSTYTSQRPVNFFRPAYIHELR